MKNEVKILLVEDEVISAMMLEIQLKEIGYRVIQHVTSGESAVSSCRLSPPDVIIMDIRLADKIDGIEAAALIRSEYQIPVIFVTGYEDEAIKSRAMKLSPLAYLIKPVNIERLKEILLNSI